MAQVSIARRYAKALLEVAADSAEADRMGEQLEAFAHILQNHAEFAQVVSNPGYSQAEKQAVLGKLVELANPAAPVSNLLKLLLERSRLLLLVDIARIYRDLADAKAGRVRGKVLSAVELPTETLSRLSSTLEKVAQKRMVLEAQVEPSLIGGVSAQVGSLVFDGSVKNQLEELRRSLRG